MHATVPRGHILRSAPLDQWRRKRSEGFTPEQLASAIKRAERGDLEDVMDVMEYMLRTDPHVSSTYPTMFGSVDSEDVIMTPVDGDPESARIARFVESSWDAIRGRSNTIQSILHAHGVGLSVSEQSWVRRRGEWHVDRWEAAAPRDTGFAPRSKSIMVRTYDESGRWEWVDTAAESDRWLAYSPGSVGLPAHLSGVLFRALWYWLFKRWTITWLSSALERTGEGFFVGSVPPGASEQVRDQMLSTLENISRGHVAVKEVGDVIEIIEAAQDVGEAHLKTAEYYDDQITKLMLGSTLAVDSGVNGARSLGEEQGRRTIDPRQARISGGLAGLLTDQWMAPLIRFNSHILGSIDRSRWPTMELGNRQIGDVSDTDALNGAQVSTLLEVVQAAAGALIPRDTAKQIIIASYGMSPDQADAILSTIGQGFEHPSAVESPPPLARARASRADRPSLTQRQTMQISALSQTMTRRGSSSE